MNRQTSVGGVSAPLFQEGASMLQFFRLRNCEEQRLVYAILAGMRLQKMLDSQNPAPQNPAPQNPDPGWGSV